MSIILCILIFSSVFIIVSTQSDFTPVLQTAEGPIFGSRKTYNGRSYEEYLGVPYAAPPVGFLRWQKPQPVEPWSEPLNATKFSQHCTQFMAYSYPLLGYHAANGEDCLYLNVFVPGTVEENRDAKLPVMVFFYGGAYFFGTGEQYPSQDLALHGDVIVVTLNYRLSTLGFMSTGDSEAPGNYGLWDQNAALLWVQRNIEMFGGDKGRVTIFGQSAGGASVSHALSSPYNQGLFHNAIAISGGATSVFALAYNPLNTAMLLGEFMDCNATSTQELVACLIHQDPHKLDFWGIAAITVVTGRAENLVPVIDGDFVPMHPADSFRSGAGKDINYIAGSTYHDGAGFVIQNLFGIPMDEGDLGYANDNSTVWNFLESMIGGALNGDDVINAIIDMYPEIYSPDPQIRAQALSRAVTEWWFGAAANFEAGQHYLANGAGRTYQYQFHHRQSFLYGYPEWVTSSHIDDLYSVFGPPFNEVLRSRYLHLDFDEVDLEVCRRVMDYYTNFAHTGNPNEGPFQPEVEWAEFNSAEQNFLYVSEQFRMSSFYDDNSVDRYRFWTDIFYQMVILPPKPTFPPPADSNSVNKESETKQRFVYTEEDIEAAIIKIKQHIKTTMSDKEIIELIDQQIDEYVEERRTNMIKRTN